MKNEPSGNRTKLPPMLASGCGSLTIGHGGPPLTTLFFNRLVRNPNSLLTKRLLDYCSIELKSNFINKKDFVSFIYSIKTFFFLFQKRFANPEGIFFLCPNAYSLVSLSTFMEQSAKSFIFNQDKMFLSCLLTEKHP